MSLSLKIAVHSFTLIEFDGMLDRQIINVYSKITNIAHMASEKRENQRGIRT